MRTQEQVVERYRTVCHSDPLGFKAEVLLAHLDWAHVREFLKPDAEQGTWDDEAEPLDAEHVRSELREYMDFAWGKVEDHRGLSASRSVSKVTELAWLLGRDDAVAVIDAAPYPNYGAPKLRAACETLGLPMPETETARRMSEGLTCRPDGCPEGGCGR